MNCDKRAQIATDLTDEDNLSSSQIKALSALLAGETVVRAAEISQVDRSTVHHWLRDDWEFQAARNRAHRAIQEATRTSLLALTQDALDAVGAAISNGDIQTAINVLKGLGFLSGSQIQVGSPDPEVLKEESDLLTRENNSVRKQRSMLARLSL